MAVRSIWSGSLTFGLVSIPVKLVTAVREKSVHFNLLSKDGTSRLRRKLYSPDTGKEYEHEETARGFEIAPDRYVVVTDEEIAKLKPEKTRRMDIAEFVELAAIDPVYFDSTYYLAPDDTAAKPYALLANAMAGTKRAALVRFVMRDRQYLAAVRTRDGALILHTMRYHDEIVPLSDLGDLPSGADLPKKEVEFAERLIEALEANFDPKQYKDEMRIRLEQLIEAKASGAQVVMASEKDADTPQVVDLMDALKQSLERAKKSAPPAAANEAKPAKKKKKTA